MLFGVALFAVVFNVRYSIVNVLSIYTLYQAVGIVNWSSLERHEKSARISLFLALISGLSTAVHTFLISSVLPRILGGYD